MSTAGSVIIGIDIGGTFTDLVALHVPTGTVHREKLLTSSDPSESVLTGVENLLRRTGFGWRDVGSVRYSTTVAANAVIERHGARTALLCTAGFRDVLETRREQRYELYDLLLEYPEPLVPRRWRIGIDERSTYDGENLRSPDRQQIVSCVEELKAEGITAVAVAFLHSYANAANEQTVRDWLADEFPGRHVSISSDISPQIGEYERVSTTVVNAYIQPLIQEHLDKLYRTFSTRGLSGRFLVVTSYGGVVNASVAARVPARVIESGPAAGAAAAAEYSHNSPGNDAARDILSFDMGGTTAKSCFMIGGKVPVINELEVARLRRHRKGSGLLLRLPSVDLLEVGSGGGSIASVNSMGLLQVGPESAGSNPGPACYGLGGHEPTVTDADVILGYLDPEGRLGGSVPIQSELAHRVVSDLAGTIGMTREQAAWAIVDVVTESMAEAIRIQAAELGVDARRYTMVAFGGAGPVHAGHIGRRLGIDRIVIPPSAGVLSAYGCVAAEATTEVVMSYPRPTRLLDPSAAGAAYRKLELDARSMLGDPAQEDPLDLTYFADLQYVGQRSVVTVDAPRQITSRDDVVQLETTFHAAYSKKYGRNLSWLPVQLVNFRLRARLPRGVPPAAWRGSETRSSAGRARSRLAYMPENGMVEMPVYRRTELDVRWHSDGPAIVEDLDTTILVPANFAARLAEDGSVIMEARR